MHTRSAELRCLLSVPVSHAEAAHWALALCFHGLTVVQQTQAASLVGLVLRFTHDERPVRSAGTTDHTQLNTGASAAVRNHDNIVNMVPKCFQLVDLLYEPETRDTTYGVPVPALDHLLWRASDPGGTSNILLFLGTVFSNTCHEQAHMPATDAHSYSPPAVPPLHNLVFQNHLCRLLSRKLESSDVTFLHIEAATTVAGR